MKRASVALAAIVALLLLGGAAAAPGATVAAKTSPVSCDYTASKLTCTVPQTTVTKTVTSTVTVTATPTTTSSTTVPTTTTTSTPPTTTSSTTTPPPATGFPTKATTGVPAGWTPATTRTGDYTVSTAGATVQDMRITGTLIINAPNVTVRRVEILGGSIQNFRGGTCQKGLLVEDTSIIKSGPTSTNNSAALETGGYTARRVKIDGLPEGFRVGNGGACGPVSISDSWVNITAPDSCGDWHGDGLQGYDGGALTLRNTYIEMVERSGCGGTAPFFYPSGQGNTSVDIDGLIVKGGGFSFRLGMPGPVLNLNVVQGSWGYGPIDVKCSAVTAWTANIVTLDTNGQPVVVKGQACSTESGG